MAVKVVGSHLIAGEDSREGSHAFHNVNPRTRTPGSIPFHNATESEINRAAQAARRAYQDTRNYRPDRLAGFLDAIADEIEALGQQLLEVADEETALGIPRLTAERNRTTVQFRKFGGLLREGSYVEAIIDTAQPEREPSPRPTIRRMLVPIGPVAVFSASNFPFAFGVVGGDTASALAAGCPVIVKGHPGHPATSELFAHAVNRAVDAIQFPPGVFSLLQGDSVQVGEWLVNHPEVEAVAFTGSLRAGRAIYDAAARRPKPIPVFAEMGSVNPVVMLPGAIAERGEALAKALTDSVTLGAGQFCTNPGLVFVLDDDDSHRFIDAVAQKMADREAGVLLNEKVEAELSSRVADTLSRPAVKRLSGADEEKKPFFCHANTVLQTTSADFRADPALQVEHFGPVTMFVVCESQTDLMETVDALHGNLTAAIHGIESEASVAQELFDRLREKAGRLIWNGFPTGVEVVYAMQHGGPYPATTAPATTSVGMTAIKRFMRPVAFQGLPDELLPDALKDANPLDIWRIVDNQWVRQPI